MQCFRFLWGSKNQLLFFLHCVKISLGGKQVSVCRIHEKTDVQRQMSWEEIQTVKMTETGKGMAVIWERQRDILLLSRKQCRRFY